MTNERYWAGRLQQIAHSVYNDQEKRNLRLLQEYKGLYGNIQSQLDSLYRKYGKDGKLTNTEMYRFNRLNGLQRNIKTQVKALGQNEETFLGKSLYNNFEQVAQATTQFIQKNAGIRFDWSYIDDKFISAAIKQNWQGGNFSSRIWKNKDALLKQLNSVIVTGISGGRNINQMSADIKSTMGSGAYEALRLVRTESMHAINGAQMESFKAAGYSKVYWIAAEDERTCPTCGAHDKHRYKINEAPACPAHPLCRCTLAADPESLDLTRHGVKENRPKPVDTAANDAIISSEEYRNKFDVFPNNKANSVLCRETRRAIRQNSRTTRETAAIIDDKGNVIAKQRLGNFGGIFDIDAIAGLPDNSAVITHNHPNSTSFSDDDIELLLDNPQIQTIVAGGHNGTVYKISINKGKWPDSPINSEYNILKDKFKGDINKVVSTLAEYYGWKYGVK